MLRIGKLTEAVEMANIATLSRAGRKPGVQNKIQRELRELIEGALHAAGGRAYLVRQAEENPVAFLTLLGKILPKEIRADITGNVAISEIRRVIVRPVGASGSLESDDGKEA